MPIWMNQICNNVPDKITGDQNRCVCPTCRRDRMVADGLLTRAEAEDQFAEMITSWEILRNFFANGGVRPT